MFIYGIFPQNLSLIRSFFFVKKVLKVKNAMKLELGDSVQNFLRECVGQAFSAVAFWFWLI